MNLNKLIMKTNKKYLTQNGFKKAISSKFLILIFAMCFVNTIYAQFVHPGISHNLADLDRMKHMVGAGIEPYATSFQNLSSNAKAKSTYSVNVATDAPLSLTEYPGANQNWFLNDGIAAYYNALMWYITEDTAHADKAVEILNTYKGITNVTSSFALTSGRVWRIIEAAEIIAHTYHANDYANGWGETDIQAFKDMLVYPGYSNTVPSGNSTFYWKIYNGDPVRHGNQGLFGFRTMMAIAIFTDNQMMYNRVIRYLKGFAPDIEDIPFPTGPVISLGANITACDYFDEYYGPGITYGTVPNYHGNEAIVNYIYENGQSQESSRDQAHAIAGVSTIAIISEMAWNQGDDLYSFLNNRPLLGLEFFYRYNLSYVNSYPDQTTPWEPTVASGEYIVRSDRSGRWTSRKINPYVNCDETNLTRGNQNLEPIYEMNLGHYRDRMNLPSDDYKWLERGHAYLTSQIGVEGEGTANDHPGFGGLKFRRVGPGDPISGFDGGGLPLYKMNELPMTIEAENYDYFVLDGQDRTYNDVSSSNEGGEYRTDEGVDLKVCSEGGYNITNIEDGEWVTYTVHVPTNGVYDIDIRYASANANGKIKFNFADTDVTSEVTVPFGGDNSTGLADWKDYKVGDGITLNKGVQSMKILFSGSNNSFELNNISISLILTPENLAVIHGTASQSTDRLTDYASKAIDDNTDGVHGNGSVTHTSANATLDPEPWWQVDLGNNYNVDTIDIYNRTDCCSDRLNNFTVEVIDSKGNVTFSQFYASAPSNAFTITTGGVIGSVVRISKTSSSALALAEVEVYGVNSPVTLSNKEFELKDTIKLYPNPTSDTFTLTNSLGFQVSVYSILGKQVLTTTIEANNQKTDISHLKSGVYFVRVDNNGAIINKKIIKK